MHGEQTQLHQILDVHVGPDIEPRSEVDAAPLSRGEALERRYLHRIEPLPQPSPVDHRGADYDGAQTLFAGLEDRSVDRPPPPPLQPWRERVRVVPHDFARGP